MRGILPDLERWTASNQPIALATVIQTWGSSPRQARAKMGMAAGNQITGSVSGGCIEGAVYEEGMAVLESGRAKLLHFGVADETAWEVGLADGGLRPENFKNRKTVSWSNSRTAANRERSFVGRERQFARRD